MIYVVNLKQEGELLTNNQYLLGTRARSASRCSDCSSVTRFLHFNMLGELTFSRKAFTTLTRSASTGGDAVANHRETRGTSGTSGIPSIRREGFKANRKTTCHAGISFLDVTVSNSSCSGSFLIIEGNNVKKVASRCRSMVVGGCLSLSRLLALNASPNAS